MPSPCQQLYILSCYYSPVVFRLRPGIVIYGDHVRTTSGESKMNECLTEQDITGVRTEQRSSTQHCSHFSSRSKRRRGTCRTTKQRTATFTFVLQNNVPKKSVMRIGSLSCCNSPSMARCHRGTCRAKAHVKKRVTVVFSFTEHSKVSQRYVPCRGTCEGANHRRVFIH